jgi:hypothetical protein
LGLVEFLVHRVSGKREHHKSFDALDIQNVLEQFSHIDFPTKLSAHRSRE